MLVVEVNNGFCRKPFEVEALPRSTLTSHFVDITNIHPRPDEFWRYNYATGEFVEPEDCDGCDFVQRWNDIRNTRQIMLMESDWAVLPDSPLGFFERRRWKKYRQFLRDIPEKYADDNPIYVQFPPRPDRVTSIGLIDRLMIFFSALGEKNGS